MVSKQLKQWRRKNWIYTGLAYLGFGTIYATPYVAMQGYNYKEFLLQLFLWPLGLSGAANVGQYIALGSLILFIIALVLIWMRKK